MSLSGSSSNLSSATSATSATRTFGDFDVNINQQMQVPQRIRLDAQQEANKAKKESAKDKAPMMLVPDRIVIVGGEATSASTDCIPYEQRVEQSFYGDQQQHQQVRIQLASPPQTLHLEDTSAAVFGLERKEPASPKSRKAAKDEQQDDTALVRQLRQIADRLTALEAESSSRRLRDLLLYAGLLIFGLRHILAARNQF